MIKVALVASNYLYIKVVVVTVAVTVANATTTIIIVIVNSVFQLIDFAFALINYFIECISLENLLIALLFKSKTCWYYYYCCYFKLFINHFLNGYGKRTADFRRYQKTSLYALLLLFQLLRFIADVSLLSVKSYVNNYVHFSNYFIMLPSHICFGDV